MPVTLFSATDIRKKFPFLIRATMASGPLTSFQSSAASTEIEVLKIVVDARIQSLIKVASYTDGVLYSIVWLVLVCQSSG